MSMTQDELKQAVAEAALAYIRPHLENETVLGIGTGSTANLFIDCLAEVKGLQGPVEDTPAPVPDLVAAAQRVLRKSSSDP